MSWLLIESRLENAIPKITLYERYDEAEISYKNAKYHKHPKSSIYLVQIIHSDAERATEFKPSMGSFFGAV